MESDAEEKTTESEKTTETEDVTEITEVPEPNVNEISFTEFVAVDNEECMIKIKSIDPDNFWGYTIKVQLENKSDSKTYMFSVDSAAINGVKSVAFFATEVAAGKKANDEIIFTTSDLKENGINNFTDIELSFRVYDSNDWLADDVANESVHVYPFGEENATKYVREVKNTDNVLFDNENLTVIVTGYSDDNTLGYDVELFLVNKTDTELWFTADEESVNGFMIGSSFVASVPAGKCAFETMTWYDSYLEENEITEIEEIEFLLRVYDMDDLFDGDILNEVVKLNP